MKYQLAKPFLFLVAFILVVGLACGLPTANEEVPEPPAPTATPIPQPTAILAPTDIPAPVVERFFTEEFDSDTDSWSYFLTSGNENEFDLFTENGRLVFDLNGEQIYSYVTYDVQDYDNVRIDVEINNRGYNTNNVSLICRYDEDDGWYEFNISNGGLYWILYGNWNDNGTSASYTPIVNGGSNKVKAGKETNQYTAICNGRTLSLYINGFETKVIDDNRFVLREGLVGISVASFNVYPINVEYEWVRISQP